MYIRKNCILFISGDAMYLNESDFHLNTAFSIFPDREPFSYFHRCNYDSPENHPLHINSGIEIFIPLQGLSAFMVDGSLYSLEQGDVVIVRPHQVHKTVLRSACLYERASTVLPADLYEGFRFNPFIAILDSNCTHFTPNSETKAELLRIIGQMDSLLLGKQDDTTSMLAFSLITRLVCITSRSIAEAEPQNKASEDLPLSRCRQVLSYINENLAAISSVSMLAEHFGLSIPYLSTLFKQEIGVNLNAYLRARKIGLAKRLLSEGASVTDACFECGFSDCSYFIRCFKSNVGVTPLQYRKQRRFES